MPEDKFEALSTSERLRIVRESIKRCNEEEQSVRVAAVNYGDMPVDGCYGVFAICRIEPGTEIGRYVGIRLTPDELEDRFPGTMLAPYAIRSGDMIIDSQDPRKSNFARFINGTHSSRPETGANVEYVYDTARRDIFVVAKRPVDPGEELIADYGDDYWGPPVPSL